MSSPKRHHFVPESYLRGFVDSDSGFLHVYSKHSRMWRRQKPKQVMVRNRFYCQDWAPAGVDKNILEKRLGAELEPKGLRSLRKLVDAPEAIDDEDTANILIYLQFQRIRVPRQAKMASSLLEAMLTRKISETAEGREYLKYGRVVIKDSFRFDFMRTLNGVLTPFFSRMVWELVEAEPGASFITSDSPVSFYNVDFMPPLEAGPALYGTFVLFPIDKRFLLVMRHPEYESGDKEASEPLHLDLDVEDGVIRP